MIVAPFEKGMCTSYVRAKELYMSCQFLATVLLRMIACLMMILLYNKTFISTHKLCRYVYSQKRL